MQDKDLKLFVLNNEIIRKSDLKKLGFTISDILLDFIRYGQNLKGTKIGCREGDCGACTVMVGQLNSTNSVSYRTIVSCLTPIGNVLGTHVVSIEGINLESELTPVQNLVVEEGGTQCGACTPGFIVSLTNMLIENDGSKEISPNLALDGNICRCTGYKSIERAALNLVQLVNNQKLDIPSAVEKELVPEYFPHIKEILADIKEMDNYSDLRFNDRSNLVGGGTDLYVQRPDEIVEHDLYHINLKRDLSYIKKEKNLIRIGSSTTFSELMESEILQEIFPSIIDDFSLIASTPIRNIATIGGNIVNASPIADTVIFFLVLDPTLTIMGPQGQREVRLTKFYKGYKDIDLQSNEYLEELSFVIPPDNARFNFEKVSKRTYLDIASVNSAIYLEIDDNGGAENIKISAGGVAPIPVDLQLFSKLSSREILTIMEAGGRDYRLLSNNQVSPITDIRGSAEYKGLLLQQLILAHLITLFPNIAEQGGLI